MGSRQQILLADTGTLHPVLACLLSIFQQSKQSEGSSFWA